MTKSELATAKTTLDPSILEKVLVKGDLKDLTSSQRLSYYKTLCENTGLDPLTKPFEYLVLKGQLKLYATKSCTDQLRKIYSISVDDIERQVVEGNYEVLAKVSMPDGRKDMDMGAVPIKGLAGDALCNAKKKAVTQAKRRSTLSLIGLGMLDDTEVSQIDGAKRYSADDMHSPEPAELVHEPVEKPVEKESKKSSPKKQDVIDFDSMPIREQPRKSMVEIAEGWSVEEEDRNDYITRIHRHPFTKQVEGKKVSAEMWFIDVSKAAVHDDITRRAKVETRTFSSTVAELASSLHGKKEACEAAITFEDRTRPMLERLEVVLVSEMNTHQVLDHDAIPF